ALVDELRSWPGLHDLTSIISGTARLPSGRLQVRVKQEIIAFGVEGFDPTRYAVSKLAPRELEQWLDEGRSVTLLDSRNDYEVEAGTFKRAVSTGIGQFRVFPGAVVRLDPHSKRQPIVVFCTSGLRSETAAPFLVRAGFEQVFQLEGGIQKYLAACGRAHFEGECFVFDRRTGLDPALHSHEWTQCSKCRTPLSGVDQAHPHYAAGKS